jgi:tripartite-type tricarboxylate transporter receptor subunit TctC
LPSIILAPEQLVERPGVLTIALQREEHFDREGTPMRKFVAACAAAVGVVCLTLSPASAQDYPTKPIHMIVPYPAGGGTDVVARIMADHVSKILGQTIYIDNRGGANGAIGLTALKQVEPDGYTIGFTADTSLTVNLYLYKDLAYDALKDFIPVCTAVRLPGMLAANTSFPANNIAELIALAKQKPNGIAYGSAGVGNFSHLAMVLFTDATGTQMLHVPYKGTGPLALGIIGGEVQIEFNNVSTLLPYVKDGKLKALAVAEPKRMPEFPDWPAVAETVPGFEMAPWVGMIAPVGTPKPIVDKLTAAMQKVLANPDVIKQLADQQLTVMALPQDKFAALIRADQQKWDKVVKAAGIKME